MSLRGARDPRPAALLVAVAAALHLATCADAPDDPLPEVAPEVDSLARPTGAEIEVEIETLTHEIRDLSGYLESGAVDVVPGAPDPRALVEAARVATGSSRAALASGDTAGAVDRLEVAAQRVEEIKRALGLAEEWSEELPATDS